MRITFICAAGIAVLLPLTAQARLQHGIRFRAAEPITVPAGEDAGLQAFVFADVNKDDRPDLVVINRDEDGVLVHIGRGDGTFDPPQFYELDDTPTAVAVADLSSPFASDAAGDIDGNPDIIVADEDGFATLLLGRGDGGFDPPEQDLSDVLDSSELHGLVVADFDHNGRLDLAFIDLFDEVYFLCNVGGSFAACLNDVIETAGTFPIAIAGGDFDGDMNPDIAVLNQDSHDLSPIFGNGDGSFRPVDQTVPTAAEGNQEPRDLVVGRFDADANDDLIVGNFEQFSDLVMTELNGLSNRRFRRQTLTAPFGLAALAAADFDADANQDLLMVVGETTDISALSRGDGSGGFLQPVVASGFPAGAFRAASVGDLDGDSKPDVGLLSADGSTIHVLLNDTREVCAGDCNENNAVTIEELVLAVSIALGGTPAGMCESVDVDGSNTVAINELIAAVGRALSGCSS